MCVVTQDIYLLYNLVTRLFFFCVLVHEKEKKGFMFLSPVANASKCIGGNVCTVPHPLFCSLQMESSLDLSSIVPLDVILYLYLLRGFHF